MPSTKTSRIILFHFISFLAENEIFYAADLHKYIFLLDLNWLIASNCLK